MSRSLQPCGSAASYRRHLRHGEVPCDACRVAHSSSRREQRSAARDQRRLRVVPPAPVEGPVDVVAKMRWNVGVLEAAMGEALPREVAALARQHAAAVGVLAKLEAGSVRSSRLDQLAAARRQRLERAGVSE